MHLPSPSALAAERRFRRADRRLQRVAADPAIVTMTDIRLLLDAHGVDAERVDATLYRVELLGFDAALLWEWVMAFDGTALAKLVCSESPDYMLESALVDGITIHREFSEMYAD